MRRPRSNVVLRIAAAVLLVVAAGIATVTAPDEDEEFGAIDVRGRVGEIVHTRSLDVSVGDVRIGEALGIARSEFDPVDSTTRGVWVVVDATITWNVRAGSLSDTVLQIGSMQFQASEIQPSPALMALPAQAGVPVTGSFAFELPRSAIGSTDAAAAEIRPRFTVETGPDTVPVVTVDLAALEARPVVDLLEAREDGLR